MFLNYYYCCCRLDCRRATKDIKLRRARAHNSYYGFAQLHLCKFGHRPFVASCNHCLGYQKSLLVYWIVFNKIILFFKMKNLLKFAECSMLYSAHLLLLINSVNRLIYQIRPLVIFIYYYYYYFLFNYMKFFYYYYYSFFFFFWIFFYLY